MKATVFLSVLLCCMLGAHSLIIPDELPSLLSVVYSNIPTLKKGTDSRIGWGFRLGDRADFQVLVELGPQKYTEPLRNQPPKEGGSKRNTLETLTDTLYAQNQELKRLKSELEKEEVVVQNRKQEKERKDTHKKATNVVPNPDAAEWLNAWSAAVKKGHVLVASKPKPGLGIGEIDAKSVIPEDIEDKLVNGNVKELIQHTEVSTKKPTATTSKEDALDNVDLE